MVRRGSSCLSTAVMPNLARSLYLRVRDVDQVAKEFAADVVDQPWGREMRLTDRTAIAFVSVRRAHNCRSALAIAAGDRWGSSGRLRCRHGKTEEARRGQHAGWGYGRPSRKKTTTQGAEEQQEPQVADGARAR